MSSVEMEFKDMPLLNIHFFFFPFQLPLGISSQITLEQSLSFKAIKTSRLEGFLSWLISFQVLTRADDSVLF